MSPTTYPGNSAHNNRSVLGNTRHTVRFRERGFPDPACPDSFLLDCTGINRSSFVVNYYLIR